MARYKPGITEVANTYHSQFIVVKSKQCGQMVGINPHHLTTLRVSISTHDPYNYMGHVCLYIPTIIRIYLDLATVN